MYRKGLDCRKKGFTLVELLVVIGIIALLISILLPSLARAREAAVRIKCGSNMHQIGIAFAMYLSDNKNVYPPLWCPDIPDSTTNTTYFGTGNNTTYVSLLAKYIGSGKQFSINSGTNFGVFKCPNDNLDRATWLSPYSPSNPNYGDTLSYTMPVSEGFDKIHAHDHFTYPKSGGSAMGSEPYVNRGMGQNWDGYQDTAMYPMAIKSNFVRAPGLTLLLIERANSYQTQNTVFNIGLICENPSQQLWNYGDPTTPVPALHTAANTSKTSSNPMSRVRFNYMFVDGHVELLSPAQTVHDTTKLLPYTGGNFGGADYMWTIDPYNYSDNY